MLKKINDFLAGWPMTLVGGVFLAASLAAPWLGIRLPIDPAWVTVVVSGLPLLYLALWRVAHNPGISKISSALLISIAMFAAIAIGDLFAAGEVAFIMAIGALLEDATTNRAKKGLKKLISLAPTQGRRLTDGREEMIPAQQIRQGDLLRILPGETIPVDGIIRKGETSVDQSVMTGESLPVDKSEGASVYCGTINRFGAIDIEATKVGADSSLQRLIRMVQEAEQKQAPMQRIADKCASWLVPVALMIAIVAYLCTGNIVTAVTILVVFCPCALVLATPTAIMAAIGNATKHGALVREGDALERLAGVSKWMFDKTGTLTFGMPQVVCVKSLLPDVDDETLYRLAAAAERSSEHPLGRAVVQGWQAHSGQAAGEANDFSMLPGRGVTAQTQGRRVAAGNEALLAMCGAPVPQTLRCAAQPYWDRGCTVIYLALDGRAAGFIALSDTLRPQAAQVVAELRGAGVQPVLLTGDNENAARAIAGALGVEEVHAGCLPEDKLRLIGEEQARGQRVCMLGDGVNDAPALKKAGVGIAMGGIGSDIAVDAADIALVNDDICELPHLLCLAQHMMRVIRCNLTFSMALNFIAILLAMTGVLNPVVGALVHNAGSVFVIVHSAFLLRWRKKPRAAARL